MIKLNEFTFFIVLLGIFFMPFNSFEGIEFLGEFKRDSCILFFLLAALFVINKKKLELPVNNMLFQVFILVILYFFLTGILNFYDLSNYYFKKTSGLSRFARQYTSLILSSLFLIGLFYNVFKNYDTTVVFYKIRKVLTYSLYVVAVYAVFELFIVKFNMVQLLDILRVFDYFPFTEVRIDTTSNRLSSVTFESPALATYLLSISGWMFSYVLTDKKLSRFFPILLTIVLSFLSGSRAGIFIIIIQIMVFLAYIIKDKKFHKLFARIFSVGAVLVFFALLFFANPIYEYALSKISSFKTSDDVHAISNKSRFGIQVALFEVFLENPIKGTGYGLQAYESKDLYPEWAVKDNWEFKYKYLNENHKSFPPGYNLYVRLLAETGIIGFSLFMFFILLILLWCFNKAFKKQGSETIIPIVIAISMVGFLLNWFKSDTFRIYFFWLCLTLIIMLQKEEKKKNYEEKISSPNSALQ
ncbi:O-antigen ligase family protein [Winogradskyella bathintestinalis]|uniref:O-antigen ligase family protein n=1 Tax=Winogradskyella bathintestinalis TaxID=3035208 RepID=A0ABT7ZRF1_9FLAO|nr:O-antigen ligase family protein [Winogradskyella bathintestinalis]MDN3491586.1 O-antigen ligase family protein [Winogradskyella bathintestinalis]